MTRRVATAMTCLSAFVAVGTAMPRGTPAAVDDVVIGRTVHLLAHGSTDPTVTRSVAVVLDDSAVGSLATGDHLWLETFADRSPLTGSILRVERSDDGRSTWTGRLAGGGSFLLTARGREVHGVFRPAGRYTYRLHTTDTGLREVREVDPRDLPGCTVETVGPFAAAVEAGGPACDTGAVLDVLVVYTPVARDAAGGDAAIEAEIELAVASTNLAYADSAITPRINLVHVAETSYDENGSYNDHATRLRAPADGFMDEVHDLRDQFRADLTALIVADGDLCGAGFIMGTVSPDFESSAFSVTTWFCAVNSNTFAHELGHNLGCGHDRVTNVVPGAFDHSFGHRFTDQDEVERRTIMALAPGDRIGHFSNPDVVFNGDPTGVAAGETDSADNVATINQTSFITANFRCSFTDCNGNGVNDPDDLAAGTSIDCDGNEVPDECDLVAFDCNANGVPDACDIAAGAAADKDGNGVPDSCEDCNANGRPDSLDLADGTSVDCDDNDRPDECDIAAGALADDDGNGRADACESIVNTTRDTIHATIGLAIEHAAAGDVIDVGPGVYGDPIDFGGRPIVVRSTHGAGATVLDGTGLGVSMVVFASGEGNDSVLSGFTIRGSSTSIGAGVTAFSSSPTISDCVFLLNSAGLVGGAILNSTADPVIVNCLFARNTAGGRGGTIYNANSSPTIVNCTFSGNSATEGGGIFNFGTSATHVTNSILWGNDPGAITDDATAVSVVTYSDVRDGWAGDGFANLDADPAFASPLTDDYRLMAGSPCIDAGNNDALPADRADADRDGDPSEALTLDLDGAPRRMDDAVAPDTGSPVGGAPLVDLGAYEAPVCRPDCARPGSRSVDIVDLLAVLADWGATLSTCDLDDDDLVGIGDLLIVLGAWGECP